jgi:hypothetical protein
MHWRAEGWDTDLDQAYELVIDTATTLANYQNAAAAAITVGSANGADDKDSTGVTYLTVWYLNSNYVLNKETIALEGTAAQTVGAGLSDTNCLRVLRIEAAAVGSGGVAAGVIYAKTSTVVNQQILAGNNRSYGAIFTVPAGHVARIKEIGLHVAPVVGDYVDFKLLVQDVYNSGPKILLAGPWQVDPNEAECTVIIPGSAEWEFSVGTDIWIEADSNAASKPGKAWIEFDLYSG